MDQKRMRLRYAGTCRICDTALPARTEAIYERATRTVSFLTHGEPRVASSDAGAAGGSARRFLRDTRRHQARPAARRSTPAAARH